jgi:8-oxo-dGTP pyrophosphatase MutT (NUDIX family)
MYKIYINNTPLFLLRREELASDQPSDEHNLVARYSGKAKLLLSYADLLEKNDRFQSVCLYSDDYDQLIRDFWSHYHVIEAAGGVVFNTRREVLMIFRGNHWDLPKGKIDPGESREMAAVREVQEETGLGKLSLGDCLTTTYHTYRGKKKGRILKITYWYWMETEEETLVPQVEEDIEKAVWRNPAEFLANNQEPVYRSIHDVLSAL